jgi:hypothetical protein
MVIETLNEALELLSIKRENKRYILGENHAEYNTDL